MNILDIAIAKKLAGGGGGSGTDNYNDLSNLPKINDTTLSGNKSSSALGLQSEINSDSKLASDLVDDTNQDNKFVTSTEKNTWNGKQNAIDADHKLSSDLVDDANKTNKFVTSTEKNTWNAKQNAIDSDHKLSSSLVSFSTAEAAALASGIDSSKVGQISTNQTNILLVQDATKELVDKGAKNIVPTIGSISKISGGVDITWTVDSDGYITANPTNSDGRGFVFASCQYVFSLEENKSYELVVEVKTASTYSSAEIDLIRNDGTRVVTKGMKDVTGTWHTTVTIGAGNGGVYGIVSKNFDGVWRIMLCTKSEYDINSTYQLYAIPNYELTKLESEDRSNILYSLQNGVKNLFNLEADEKWSYSLSSQTVDTKTGTLSITSNSDWARVGIPITLPAGNYVISGNVTSLVGNALLMGNTEKYDSGTAVFTNIEITTTGAFTANFTLNSATTFWVTLYANYSESIVSNSVTITGMMICTKAAWDQEPNVYRPFALPNYDLTRMVSELQKKAVKVYTYHVNPNESDPEDAVTYLDDATGLTPAKMGASSFSYGSWANAWFLPRPCMLKSDGTVAYYLNPNDYSKKTDGTASDIADANFDGNVMLEFPKIWVKRVNDGNGARTVSIAPVNVDGTYKCWSNINAEDKEVDHFYLPAYNGTIHSSKMRSLSGVTLDTTYAPNYTRAQEVTAATANNPTGKNLWYTETWADMCLVYDLLYLMGKSLDVQRTFGQGLSSGAETAMRAYVTGTHDTKGLFYGNTSSDTGTSTAVKVLGMENLWGCRWHVVAGLINDNGALKVKMTYGVADGSTAVGYNTTGDGYLNYGSTYGTAGYVKKMQADNTMGYKIIETAGTDATYYCDYYYVNNSQSNYALLGSSSGRGAYCGFFVSLASGAALANWSLGGSLSCRPES